jgi:peroxiredoxin
VELKERINPRESPWNWSILPPKTGKWCYENKKGDWANCNHNWGDVYGHLKKESNKSIIKGMVVDMQGKSAPDVWVICYRISGPFPCEIDRIKTDSKGRYQFGPPADQTYEIHAGGLTSTFTKSSKFDFQSGETYEIENLKVRLAINSCKGTVLYEDGKPAANLPYGYLSKSFVSTFNDPESPPKTDDKGQFSIPYLLPDELFSFWVFPKENTLCVWRKLDPNIQEHKFIVKPSDFIELPSDWLRGGFTHHAIARQTTYAEDSRIQFTLPDLQGNMVSLQDKQYKNKAVLVNIYGSWCGGCQQEIPYLIDFKNKYEKEGLEVIGIAFEHGSEEQQLHAFKETPQKFEVNYPLLFGGNAEEREKIEDIINNLKDFKGYPTTLYIDRNGIVKHIQVGFWINTEPHKKWQIDLMEKNIQKILAENSER